MPAAGAGDRVDDDGYSTSLTRELRSTFGGSNHTSSPAAARGQSLHGDLADAAFLERQGARGADQVRGKLAEIRLVSDERDAPALCRLTAARS